MASLPEKATHQKTRTFNQQLVLRAIHDRNETSRAEVARVTGLTRTSVSALVGELLRDGLVEEVGVGPSTGGKAPILVRVHADGRHVIGLDLGEMAFSGAVVNLLGEVIRHVSLPLEGRDGEDAVRLVLALVEDLHSGNGSAPLLGIGIGAPGLIDSRRGTVRWSANLNWKELPLGPLIEERFGTPVVVANDSQAAAVAETTFGPMPRPANLVVVRVGRGIGAGIIINGQLYQGDGAGAGEIGHATFGSLDADEAPALCHCGRVGCLETIASMPAMVAAAGRRDPKITDEAALVAAVARRDPAALEVVVRAGEMLGRGIAALINVLNINQLLLIGSATQLGDPWLDAIRRHAEGSSLPLLARDTRIELGRRRDDDVLIGASALLMTQELGLSLAR